MLGSRLILTATVSLQKKPQSNNVLTPNYYYYYFKIDSANKCILRRMGFVRFRGVGHGVDGYGCFWNIIISVAGNIKMA